MAEGAISYLLSTIASIIQNDELNLFRGGVSEEIEFIRSKFEQFTALLQEAGPDKEDKEWVKQARDTAYDAGDVLELFIYRLEHRRRRGELKVRHRIASEKTILKNLASEIQKIKLKVVEVSQRQASSTEREQIVEKIKRHAEKIRAAFLYRQRARESVIEESENEFVGMDKTKTELINWLVDEEVQEKRVLSVCGMGGSGKTKLVKMIYDDSQLVSHFEARAWITVSRSFQTKKLLKETIKQMSTEVGENVPVEAEKMEQTDLVNFISNFLQKKRYVIVLDDIWENDAWEALKRAFPNNNRGSRVIITTRGSDVASFACNESNGKVHNLLPLPPVESRTLFCRKVFRGNPCPSNLEETMEAILKKCDGLPLAIVSIGGLLATKGQSIDEWNKISCGLGAELRKEGKLANLDKVLSLSYFDLPWYLKPCFLYLSIFPKDYSIHRWRLIHLWIAEGFVHSTEGQTAEEVAGSYLTELTDRSLILIKTVGHHGRAKEYHIHDLWRELIISKSSEYGFVNIYGAEQNDYPLRVRRLSIHNEMGTRQVFKYRATHLRSLFMFGSIVKKYTSPIVNSLGHRSKLLKILSLRGNRNLEEIPKSIGDLQMLEILDLKDTRVRKLPDEILKLRRLRFLLVCSFPGGFNCHHGFKALKGMQTLLCLEKLCTIELNDLFQKKIELNDERNNNDDILRSISELTRLRKFNIIGLRSRDALELCSTLEKLTELRSLCIATTEILSFRWRDSIDLEPISSPPKYLETLIVKANMERLPQWIASLPCLTKLILNDCGLKEDPLLQLQDLPNLIYLQLNRAYEGEALCFEKAGTFKKLKTLRLDLLWKLKRVSVTEGVMPRLENLSISNCRMMKELPSGIETLSSLSLLSFYGMSPAFPSKLIADLKNRYAFEIAHIPTVCVEGDGNSMACVGNTDN